MFDSFQRVGYFYKSSRVADGKNEEDKLEKR